MWCKWTWLWCSFFRGWSSVLACIRLVCPFYGPPDFCPALLEMLSEISFSGLGRFFFFLTMRRNAASRICCSATARECSQNCADLYLAQTHFTWSPFTNTLQGGVFVPLKTNLWVPETSHGTCKTPCVCSRILVAAAIPHCLQVAS